MDDNDFPTPEQAKRHFDAQDRSVFRKPGSRDPGVTILNDPKEAKALIASELAGNQVATYKTRNPATTFPDPAADMQRKIRSIHAGRIAPESFKENIDTVQDYLLYEIAFGDQTSNQRAKNLVALAKLLHEEQKRIDELVHRERQLEAKKTDQLLKGRALQEQMLQNKAKREAMKGGKPKVDGE
ncbi:hypothetical protein [Sphingobium sp. LSP13-1-1.1]|uniref:hypothetical protein n=1 Tax=Sphingobium sp. LSP13-1-1.1 TaxID=3135234 RepID=UPI00343F5028